MTDIVKVKSIVLSVIHAVEGDTKRADEATHAILSALNLTPEAASALMDGTAVVVPREPQQAQKTVAARWFGERYGRHISVPAALGFYKAVLASSPYRSSSNDD